MIITAYTHAGGLMGPQERQAVSSLSKMLAVFCAATVLIMQIAPAFAAVGQMQTQGASA